MNNNLLKKTEITGIFFIMIFSLFLRYYYQWGGGALAVLVSSVNNSIWENIKVFVISYMIWGAIEILTIRPSFKRFVVAKVITIYIAGLSGMIILCAAAILLGKFEFWLVIALIIVFVCFSQFASYRLISSQRDLKKIFVPSVFLLVLLIVMLCCFSVFPPQINLFKDFDTGLFGIIPEHIDIGAFYLDKFGA